MGRVEKESYPTLFIHDVIDWKIDDPKSNQLRREIRDVIESRVKELVSNVSKTKQLELVSNVSKTKQLVNT